MSTTRPRTSRRPADRDCDALLFERLIGQRPDYGWLSEEIADTPERLGRQRVWIVDPIDGTSSFVAGLPEFTISIGLADRGKVVVGVIANPATGALVYATAGDGAFASTVDGSDDPRPIHVTERATADGMVVAGSRSEARRGEFESNEPDWSLELSGSTALRLARVALGEADVFWSRPPKNEWDLAAGDLIVREAGGEVSDADGQRIAYNRPDPRVPGVLATNGALHTLTLQFIA